MQVSSSAKPTVIIPKGWHELYPDILLKIFAYLNNRDLFKCSTVCMGWNRAFLQKIHIVPRLQQILLPHVLKTFLCSERFFDPAYRNDQLDLCMDLSREEATDADIAALFDIIEKYPWLPSLSLAYPFERFNKIASIFTRMTTLTNLNLGYTYLEDQPIPSLPPMSQLKKLTIESTFPLLMGPVFLQGLTNLTHLNLHGNYEDTAVDLPQFPLLPFLKCFKIEGNFNLVNSFFIKMPGLEHLTMNDLSIFNLNSGLSNLQNLRSFSSRWPGNGFNRIVSVLPHSLEELTIDLIHNTQGAANIQALTRLRTLSYRGDGTNCGNILLPLLNTTSLRTLSINNHGSFPKPYENLPVWEFLETFKLTRLSTGSPAELRNILKCCHRLQSLYLDQIPLLTSFFDTILEPVPSLQRLHLGAGFLHRGETQITNAQFDRLEQLKEFHLNDIIFLLNSVVRENRLGLVERLLKTKSSKSPTDLQHSYRHICQDALFRGNVKIVELFLRYNRFPLHAILGSNDQEVALGETPLLFALNCWARALRETGPNQTFAPIVKLLLDAGANVFARRADGRSAFQLAQEIRDPKLMQQLEEAKVQQFNRSGY